MMVSINLQLGQAPGQPNTQTRNYHQQARATGGSGLYRAKQ
jgi:hypothetical protein